MRNGEGLLMIVPSARTSPEPLIDELTRKMTAAWRNRDSSDYAYMGVHVCGCHARSDNKDHWVRCPSPNQEFHLTNSLCIHYLAFHRADVPQTELDKVRRLPYGEEEPDERELAMPAR